MGPAKTDVVVIGEGITGLCSAYWLKKRGLNVILLSKEKTAGGTMKSVQDKGFLYETGPNTALETSRFFKELVSELKLEKEFCYARPEGKNRYILRSGVLHSMPLGPGSLLTTKLFSSSAKLRIFKEPFIGKAEKEESIAEFVERRLGREFLDYAIDPFVAGVFAGNPEQLSVRSAFPKLYALEEKYGGLIKGMVKGARERKKREEKSKDRAETFSFVNGMQVLPLAVADSLGGSVIPNAKVTGIRNLSTVREEPADEPDARRYLVEYLHNDQETEIEADCVIFAIPAYDASQLIRPLSADTAHVLASIYYPPIVSVFLGVDRKNIGHKLDGFGFLIPTREKRKILGCLWTSCLFPNRAPEGIAALNAFIGGARQPELTTLSDERIIQITLDELRSTMQLSGNPVYLHLTRWQKSIPQYEIGYGRKIEALEQFEEKFPGIVLAGNYRRGISVGDCVINAHETVEKIYENIISIR
ncbi:MAG: protoporphyrinogen oxidase [Bacteroidetes bacterium]|nr:protoporphyrinogen oxidase [Bacteroidota bacterium]